MRMFRERPWFGFGPGTYQFKYFEYQSKDEMTPISGLQPMPPGVTTYTWSPETGFRMPGGAASAYQGSGGSAHSEYFLALSETGIFSAIAFLGLMFVSLRAAINSIKTKNLKSKTTAYVVILGLTTYFVHGLFNNFLDDCKLAFLFWSSLAAIAAIEKEGPATVIN
jgi:O-antigen ligase